MVASVRPSVPRTLPLGRDSVAWRVNSEATVFAGGGRALLMQVAHPAVGAGVQQHSSYASDPWGRLFRTVDIMMKLSFGSPAESARQQRTLYAMHRRVTGTTDEGVAYRALDPALLVWVWATLVDTALTMYERVRPELSGRDRDRYYEESKLVAYGCGVPDGGCPADRADFANYIDEVVGTRLRVTDAARSVAVAAMHPPLPGIAGRLAAGPNQLVTVGLMAPSLRDQYGFDWSRADQRRLDRWFTTLRTASRVTPAPARRAAAVIAVRQKKVLRVPWLQRRGAELTAERLAASGFES